MVQTMSKGSRTALETAVSICDIGAKDHLVEQLRRVFHRSVLPKLLVRLRKHGA